MSLEKSIRELIEGRENIQAVPRPDNKDRKKIQNVGRTDSEIPTSDKSTLTRTSEIKKKIIDEKEQPMTQLKTSSSQDLYSKVLAILEGKDPKEIKKEPETKSSEKKEKEGEKVKLSPGKTEVDVEPETKSQADIDKQTDKEDEKAEKKAENGDKKKKDMKETLHPNQKKLDVAEPKGKLTSADFKKLRKEDVEMDEARGVAAGAVDAHNCATHVYHEEFGEGKTIYSQHADPDTQGVIAWYDVMFEHGIEREMSIDEMKIVASESHERHKKMKKEEVEELDEIGDTAKGRAGLRSYIRLAGNSRHKMGQEIGKKRMQPATSDNSQKQLRLIDKDSKRAMGVGDALRRLTREEVEAIDELHGKGKLGPMLRKYKGDREASTNQKDYNDSNNKEIRTISMIGHNAAKDAFKKIAPDVKFRKNVYRGSKYKAVGEDAVASAQKSSDQKMKAASINAKATVQADKIKDQARKQAKMNNSFEPEAVDPIIEASKKAIERISKNPAAPFNDAVKGVKGTDAKTFSSD